MNDAASVEAVSTALRGVPPRDASSLSWSFDGPLAVVLADLEDSLRRAIVQIGGVRAIVVLIEFSLPALQARRDAGDELQPAWSRFLARISRRYDLPVRPLIRHRRTQGPLVTLIIAYRS